MPDPLGEVTVIVLTKNEAASIGGTLETLRDFSDVVVVDSGSDDATARIAREHGARVVDYTWDGGYPKKRQWSLENAGARNPWVLFIDADEAPSAELVSELRERMPELRSGVFGGYDIRIRYRFAGRFLRHGHRVVKRVLIDRRVTSFPVIDDLDVPGMGELEGHYQPQTTKPVGRMRAPLLHDDRDPVGSWFDRHNRYADWEAHLAASRVSTEVRGFRSGQGRLFARVPFKPLAFFLYDYVIRGGFLDGRAGFDYAIALSTYYWQIGVRKRELQRRPPNRSAAARSETARSNPKIVQVIPSIATEDGGPSTVAIEFARALADRGADSLLLTTTWGLDGSLPRGSPEVRVHPTSRPASAKNSWALLGSIWRESRDADLIYLHGQYLAPHVMGYLAARLRAVPYGVQPHGTLEPYDRSHSRGRKRLFNFLVGRSILRHADFVAFASEAEANEAADVVPKSKALVVRPGASLVLPAPTPSLERLLGDIPRERVVLSLGRLAPVKRLDVLVEAWADQRGAQPRRLVIAGPEAGVTRTDLLLIAESLGVADELVFVDTVEGAAKAWLFERCGLFVLTSDTENFGVVVIEAMAAGCAVIASARVGAAELVRQSGGGVVLDPLDRVALARALAEELSSPELLRGQGERAREFARRNLGWDAAVQTIFARAGTQRTW